VIRFFPLLHELLSRTLWTEDRAVGMEVSKIKAIYHVTDLDCWQRLEEVSALANSFMNELPVHATQIMLVHTL
jgi:hypothetical protein